MNVDPRKGRAVYHQIADELRKKITSGGYEAGSRLPTETELIETYDSGRVTVRRALAVLAQEGLIESRRGEGVFVRRTPPLLRLGNTRFSRADRERGLGAFAAEAEKLGVSWEQESLGEIEVTDTPQAAIEVLGEANSAVRYRRMILAGTPTQLANSYVPASLAEEIGWSRGEAAPGGLYGLLEQHGYQLTSFRETVVASAATPDEAVALQINQGVPVARVTRVAFAGERAVEWFESVAVGDSTHFVYEFDAAE
ncbi:MULTISPECIES: GntR family transcriptional regulator [Actinoalloteichus]|uniref:Transcriptional regulator n=1 Tax=Actinoalloteichus fjordicus TaxID=1612552 RepID=A0AAC9PUP6_9PSEU|nr:MULTISPECIES: GntR family transcriptional regulator [Actinoalloteichus]APU17332.1 transcriptional regulator [Actinoalloteichus fjordicus]APU23416.1 transcriptional regulator [Actinoalloteichus sp. GBA129-24]